MRISSLIGLLILPVIVYAARGHHHSHRIPSDSKEDLKPKKTHSQHSHGRKVTVSAKLKPSPLPQGDNPPSSLEYLKPNQKVLYDRAMQHDFDFAQFSKPCKVYSVDELEAYLEAIQATMEPSDPRPINLEKVGNQLENIFNQSVVICDYRNFLTCHKTLLTCACALRSMGVNHDGICGVKMNFPCKISKRKLEKHGIPARVKSRPVECLSENAECGSESDEHLSGNETVSLRRICKCRNGFWGPSCSGRDNSHESKLKVVETTDGKVNDGDTTSVELSTELEEGQAIWLKDGVMSHEYFMHTEEIRDELIKLMIQKQMYNSSEERFEEATKLVASMEVDLDKEEMVINDIHFRKLANLKFGSQCDPEPQVIIDNPPVSKDSAHRWIDPPPEDIKSWQLGFIQQNKPLCNTTSYLRCSPVSRKCECKAGLEMDTQTGFCHIPLGHNCNLDFHPIMEYNPLLDRKRFSELEPPQCASGMDCKDKPFFFQTKCWCRSGKCKQSFDEEQYSQMMVALHSRFTLKLGETCDPKVHQRVLTYRTDGDPGHEKRFGELSEVINNPDNRFCDIESYLNCYEGPRVCKCWKQLQPVHRESGEIQCVAMNLASCGSTFKYGKFLITEEGPQIWQVEKMLEKQLIPGCVPGAKCAAVDDPEWSGRCVCLNPNKTGENCDEMKSIIAITFRASHIPLNDSEETEFLRIFFDLNSQTVLLEQLMRATINENCDPQIGLTLERIVKFWNQIENSSISAQNEKLLTNFITATKWTKYLVSTAQGKSAGLCDATLGLRCDRSSERCNCQKGSSWVGDKCYLDKGQRCYPKPRANWVGTCIDGTRCLPDTWGSKGYSCKICKPTQEDSQCSGPIVDDINLSDTWIVPMTDTKRTAKRQSIPEKIGFMDIANDIAGKGFKDSKNYQITDTESEQKRPDSGNENSVVIPKNGKSGESEVKNYFLIRSSDEPSGEGEVRNYFLVRTLDDPNEAKLKAKLNDPTGTGGNNLTDKQTDAYKHEILHMLKDILETRVIPFNHSCFYDDDKKLSEIFPLLPLYNLIDLDTPLDITYSILSRLYWKGIAFCSRNKMLKCTASHVCGCAEDFGLIEEGGECRLKEGTHCSRDDLPGRETSRDFLSNAKKKKKFFQCQKGTVCRQFDFGLPLCVKIVGGEDEDNSGQRFVYDGSADKNGGESIHLGNILFISIVVIIDFHSTVVILTFS